MSKELKIIQNEAELKELLKTVHVNGNQYKLTNVQFECDVVVNDALYLQIQDCVFKKRFALRGSSQYDFLFKDVVFESIADFTNFTFNKNARFHGCIFQDSVRFDNTKFIALADFYSSKFCKPTIFFKTDFKDRAVFSAVIFEENVLFTYSLIESHFILRGATFKKGLDLSLTLLSGTINLFGLKIPDFYSVSDFIDENQFDKAVCVEGVITNRNKRETFRILKKELQNQGNAIDALYMAAKEKDAYSQQLKADRRLSNATWYRRLQDQLILFLGKISNSHGESWTRGVGFTIIVGFIFFYLSLINTKKYFFTFNLDFYSWDSFYEGFNFFFEFLLPTHTSDYLDGLGPEKLFKMWDFLGRIFVSFGIYQTVVAFRKYHSK